MRTEYSADELANLLDKMYSKDALSVAESFLQSIAANNRRYPVTTPDSTHRYCTICGRFLPLECFPKASPKSHSCTGTMSYCADCRSLYEIARNRVKKKEIIQHLGGKCVWCSEADWRALQVDHVAGNGSEDRRENGSNQHVTHRSVLSDTTGKFQLLCANCNQIKKMENREVPNRKG